MNSIIESKNNMKKRLVNSNPEIPNKPSKNYIPFDNPKGKCGSPVCPNFTTPYCGFCPLHCRKFHNGKHLKLGK